MGPLSATVVHSFLLPKWWLPGLGLLLTGLGGVLLGAGVVEMVWPAVLTTSTARATVAGEAMTDRLAPPAWAELWIGSPDRQPQAPRDERMLHRRMLHGRQGQARDYLEKTAAARWLARQYHPFLAWDTTSAYGAVEASRADHTEVTEVMVGAHGWHPRWKWLIGGQEMRPSRSALSSDDT